MVDLFATADNPNLGFIFSRIGQQFIEFCRHDDSSLMRFVEERLKAWFPNHLFRISEAVDVLQSTQPSLLGRSEAR